jgi:hypothetical protein
MDFFTISQISDRYTDITVYEIAYNRAPGIWEIPSYVEQIKIFYQRIFDCGGYVYILYNLSNITFSFVQFFHYISIGVQQAIYMKSKTDLIRETVLKTAIFVDSDSMVSVLDKVVQICQINKTEQNYKICTSSSMVDEYFQISL